MEEKKNWKQEAKDFYNKHKDKAIFAAKCLFTGFVIGFFRGFVVADGIYKNQISHLIDKIPTPPQLDDVIDSSEVIEYQDGMPIEQGKIYTF